MSDYAWGWIPVVDGVIGVVADRQQVWRIYYLAEPGELQRQVLRDFPAAEQRSGELLDSALRQLQEYFDGARTRFDLPLAEQALSPFSRAVHQALARIPFGAVVTYAQLAALAGSPRAARAVGRVMATNPFPIVVPCHRVVRGDGQPGEYSAAGGAATKCRLLECERQLCETGGEMRKA